MIVGDGVDAVAAWESGDWDVILMDVQMPRMDGPTATRFIRERELAQRRRRTPIIALTANAMTHQVKDYFAAGMDGFVAKPIQIERLFAALEAALCVMRIGQRPPRGGLRHGPPHPPVIPAGAEPTDVRAGEVWVAAG